MLATTFIEMLQHVTAKYFLALCARARRVIVTPSGHELRRASAAALSSRKRFHGSDHLVEPVTFGAQLVQNFIDVDVSH